MKKQGKHADSLLRVKNIMRGVPAGSEIKFWIALDHTRTVITPNHYQEFVEWLFHSQSSFIRYAALSPASSWDLLIPFRLTSNLSLTGEFIWAEAILKRQYGKIREFCKISQKLNELALRDDVLSIELLDEIEKSYGSSFWALELRIALLQLIYGIEAQKEFVHKTRVSDNVYIPFFSYWFSKRNEPATKVINYFQNVDTMIRRSINNPLAELDYVLFKLKNILPDSDDRLAAVLRSESSTSFIDLYETFLAVCKKSLSQQRDQKLKDCIIHLLNGMLVTGDARVSKLITIYGTGNESISVNIPRDISPDDLFMSGKYKEAFDSASSSLLSNPPDPWMMDCCARSLACLEDKTVNIDFPGKLTVTHLSTIYSKGRGWKESFYHLLKSSLNLRNLYIHRNLFEFAQRDSFNGMIDVRAIERSLIIKSPYLEPNEFRICASGFKAFIRDHCNSVYQGSARLEFEIIIDEGILEGSTRSFLSSEIQTIAQIHNYIEREGYEEAYRLTRQLVSCQQDYFAREATRLAVFALFKMDKFQDMITEIVRGCMKDEELRHSLSLQTILGELSWNELRPFAGTIELPIILRLYLSDYEDDKHRTNLRYAFEDFLLKHNIERPSELKDKLEVFQREQVIYLLRKIATQEIMDICLTFKSSRELDEERLNVCSVLVEIDPANRVTYESELFEITKRIRIQEGLLLVDKSRVFVDISALNRWSERELREVYNRYRELAPLKIPHGKTDFDEAVRQFLKHEKPLPAQFLRVPNNEGDDLLIQMVLTVVNEFFRNPEFGFEFFLSTRVRHGSLSGHLRGPLEEPQLITFKDEKTRQYRPIEDWFEKVPHLEEQQKSAMTDAFLIFSKEYDEIIEHLTKDYLQICSESKPLGVFSPSINAVSLHILKDLAQHPDTTFEKFIETCVETAWHILEVQLATFRMLLTDQVKVGLLKLLTNLASKLQQILRTYQYISLGTEISLAQTEVQSVIDRVAAWFLLPESGTSDVYTLEQVIDIGIEFTKNARRGFMPNIDLNIVGNIPLDASSLAKVVDCIFIMLDNVYRHSGISRAPQVHLLVEMQEERQVLRVRMESEIAKGTRSPDQEEKIERIMNTIKTGDYRTQIKAEGGSGLIKLNRMAADLNSFSFGFLSDGQFYVEVCIPFFVFEMSL